MARLSLTIFVATTLCLLAIVSTIARWLPAELNDVPIAAVEDNAPPDCYLSTDNRTTLDQLVFHHDLENVGPRLSTADVVFVGNSRSLCAFPASTCASWFQDRGLKWYHAGFPAESDVFTKHILETYNVKAKLVVVNADNFFNGKISAIARRSVDTTAFGAEKMYWESRLSFRVRRLLHQWLPHPPTQFFAQESMIVHRSLNNGSWFVGESFGRGFEVSLTDGSVVAASSHSESMVAAKSFQQFVKDRGGELLITYIPSTENHRNRASQIADALGCRFVSPQLDNLTTLDGSHLDHASAIRFSSAFLDQLESMNTVRLGLCPIQRK